ncbi:MAG: carboxymuconolactone decarboxylase family protein [Nitriliruptor sp.]|nr:MAG: carboxymuconolactone decarboxylase family protein [Nitriliruptor sp.]
MTEHVPEIYADYRERFPEVASAMDGLGAATAAAGPLDERTQRLVKLGLAIGSLAEGAVRSNARKALDLDVPPEELHHVAMLAITTCGLPTAIAGLQWIEEVLAARK